MEQRFFEQPILNSPYEYPARHWELDENRQPTNRIVDRRRTVSVITPIPAARKQTSKQGKLGLDDAGKTFNEDGQQYELMRMIESVRNRVNEWRRLPRADWRVTPETARLLQHWRHHQFSDIRPFFCQVEAVETVIWLTEVAPAPDAKDGSSCGAWRRPTRRPIPASPGSRSSSPPAPARPR